VNSAVPRPLEAVCRKAMALDPAARYASALDLAADVQRWLADEPVAAYPEPAGVRLRRWVRRHRTLVTAATVGLVLTAAGLGLGLAAVAREQQETAKERDDAREQRRRARAALDDMIGEDSLALLKTQDELLPAQRAFLERALTYYREFAARDSTDAEGRALVGRAQFRAGYIYATLRQLPEAEAAFRAALVVFKRLAADFPADPSSRRDLALCHVNLGATLHSMGKYPEAEAEYRAALAVQEKLAADFPADPNYRRDLAGYYTGLGTFHRSNVGKPSEAYEEYRAALEVLEALVADFPAVPEYRTALGLAYTDFGSILVALGLPAEAEVEYRKGLAIREKLAADFPAEPKLAASLGLNYYSFGKFVSDRGDLAAAIDWYAKAATTLEPVYLRDRRFDRAGGGGGVRLYRLSPYDTTHFTAREFLKFSHLGRAKALMQLGRFAEAVRDWDRALEYDDGSSRTAIGLGRATAQARGGDLMNAVAGANALASDPAASAETLSNTARVFAVASAAATDDAAQADRCAARAVELLRQAVAKGYAEVANLRQDADLAPLRRRADYAALLWDLADTPLK
jgi:tetratricopeptide (TPR) repeat protein